MKSICPECKNLLDLSRYPTLAKGHVIECNICGISLLVTDILPDQIVKTDIVEEGK